MKLIQTETLRYGDLFKFPKRRYEYIPINNRFFVFRYFDKNGFLNVCDAKTMVCEKINTLSAKIILYGRLYKQ